MKMFSNDVEYVIADNYEEVKQIMADLCGYGESEMEEPWDEMSENSPFTYVHEDDHRETKTVGEWIKEHGKGFSPQASIRLDILVL